MMGGCRESPKFNPMHSVLEKQPHGLHVPVAGGCRLQRETTRSPREAPNLPMYTFSDSPSTWA